jgi:hypothetical protein
METLGGFFEPHNKENRMRKDNRPPKAERTLKRGDIRDDGMVFWQYQGDCNNGELWHTESHHRERKEAARKREGDRLFRDRSDYRKKRMATDNGFRVRCNLASRLSAAIKCQGATKDATTMELAGCSVDALIAHLESQFTEGMTWENYSLRGWHVDHIRPCASFDLTIDTEQKECFHYTNLQPLWAFDNLSKGDRTS